MNNHNKIADKKPRFFGNELLGDGLCPRVYLGDTFECVSSLFTDMPDELSEGLMNGEKIEIWVEELTDEQVEAIPDL